MLILNITGLQTIRDERGSFNFVKNIHTKGRNVKNISLTICQKDSKVRTWNLPKFVIKQH
jgi:hypothetical protein